MTRALLYSRVSTSDKGQNPEVQSKALREFCGARGWTVTEQIVDHGYSGATDKRPGLSKLMSLVRTRKVDIVIVAKLDRLFRSLKHMIGALEEFESLGIQFVSLGDQIDMSTPSGRLLVHLLASFGEFERALIRERTVTGLAYARSQGKTLGRPRKCDYEVILALRDQGFSYSAIQRKLGCSRPAIHRALHGGTK
jgi:DNA invertase Pin-like site-specific DNA recombinase